jgi:[ribosomal protein S18]-alanine N-acetyltransferase
MNAARMPRDAAEPLDVKIALMHRRDVRHVMPIEQRVYPRGWSKGVFVREIAQRTTRCYLTAKVGTTLVGYAGMLIAPDEAHITNVAVAPEWQRHKLASRLLVAQARVASWRGSRALTLEVRPSNTGAQELYRKFGFVPAGMRKLYYRDPDEDGMIMWAHDIDQPEYHARLRAIEAEIPGTTAIDDEVWR